jgi:hypothetical protein
MVSVMWRREGKKVKLNVEIPPDTMAQIFIPGEEKAVTVSGGKQSFEGDFSL